MLNRWLPAVNNAREQLQMDEFHFINIGMHSDFREMKKDIIDYLKSPQVFSKSGTQKQATA